MSSGWNLWVWLECIDVGLVGVVVRRYIHFLIILLIPTPLVLALFFAAASLLLCSFLKFCSLYIFSSPISILSVSSPTAFRSLVVFTM